MLAARTGSCTTTVLLGVFWTLPSGALAQAVDAAAVSEPPALVFTVTLNWPARVAPAARDAKDHATASAVAPAGTAVTEGFAVVPSTWKRSCAPALRDCALANLALPS